MYQGAGSMSDLLSYRCLYMVFLVGIVTCRCLSSLELHNNNCQPRPLLTVTVET